ncbi:MAG: hypothetical protein OQK09_16805 [Colwellia sp.]|nr:hypothetical protein [Colwellia sp.]MCW8864142.1 hypothetical protein [Colwellia sp.]MCW9083169.1 hypothetical protein [Colwellia sp.]
MYLYLGYLLVQFYPLIVKLFETNISASSILFSVIVVFIWSLIPFIGFGLAKLLNANGKASKHFLFIFGFGIGLIENGLYFFDLLAKNQSYIGTFIIFCLFFITAFITLNKTELSTH